MPNVGIAIIDDDGGSGSPRLSRLAVVTDFEGTFLLGGGGEFIFLRVETAEGPAPNQVGSGSPASSIAWGTVTGWAITGSIFCHALPAFLCLGANGANLATVDPPLRSPFYDLGTWTYHGTGFTATPFVHHLNNPLTGGNVQWILRGRLLAGFVPVLPLAGLTVLGGSLLALGWARLARAKQQP